MAAGADASPPEKRRRKSGLQSPPQGANQQMLRLHLRRNRNPRRNLTHLRPNRSPIEISRNQAQISDRKIPRLLHLAMAVAQRDSDRDGGD